jgi:hypothetical protein
MKYLKRFNEELKPVTYRQASEKLKKIGHLSRASRLEEWADKRIKDEDNKQIKDKLDKLEKTPSFRMKFFIDEWNSQTRKKDYVETPFLEGNFYLDVYFEDSYIWDSEEIYHYIEDKTSTIQLTLSIGLFPSDKETQINFNNADEKYDLNIYKNTTWPIQFTIRLNDNGTLIEQEKSSTYWEERDLGMALFSDRKEAMKFKRFLISSLNGNNHFKSAFNDIKETFEKIVKLYNDKDDMFYIPAKDSDKNKEGYTSYGVPVGVDHDNIKEKYGRIYYWPYGEKECSLKESDYQYFEKAIKRMSINNLYRD